MKFFRISFKFMKLITFFIIILELEIKMKKRKINFLDLSETLKNLRKLRAFLSFKE